MGWKNKPSYYFGVEVEGNFHFWAHYEMGTVQTRIQHTAFGGPFQTTWKLWKLKGVQAAQEAPPGAQDWSSGSDKSKEVCKYEHDHQGAVEANRKR